MKSGATSCDLCGYSDAEGVDAPPAANAPEQAPPTPASAATAPVATTSPAQGVFCNDCGWRNPLGARYCSRCGAALQELAVPSMGGDLSTGRSESAVAQSSPTAAPSPAPRQDGNYRQMAVVLTAGALLLVIALYAITAFSKRNFVATPEPTPAPQESVTDRGNAGEEVVPATVAEQAARLRASADSLSGAVRAARLAEIVNLYLTNGLVQNAADAQRAVATELGTAVAWADAGNLSYRAMQLAEGPGKIALATQAIEAYNQSLELDPENPDVRTDMATAYLATNNPMEGVRQIRQVLDANPDHVQANFNYGVMLSMIGRTDQSIVQFERVRTLVPPGSETYQQAEMALRELQAN